LIRLPTWDQAGNAADRDDLLSHRIPCWDAGSEGNWGISSQQDTGTDLEAGLIPITVPELLRLLRDTVIPPRRDRAHRLYWSDWRRCHQRRARQAH
jgi:hypothetical protein